MARDADEVVSVFAGKADLDNGVAGLAVADTDNLSAVSRSESSERCLFGREERPDWRMRTGLSRRWSSRGTMERRRRASDETRHEALADLTGRGVGYDNPASQAVHEDHIDGLGCPALADGRHRENSVTHVAVEAHPARRAARAGPGLGGAHPGRAPLTQAAWSPETSWMTRLRTWDKSAPSPTSTWEPTPSPSRTRPSRTCSVPM